MANIEGIRCIKITGKVIVLIGITFAVLTWALLYGRAGGIGGLIMFLGALSYPVGFGGLVWAGGWIAESTVVSFTHTYVPMKDHLQLLRV